MKNKEFLRFSICALVVCLFIGLAPWYSGVVRAAEVSAVTEFRFEDSLNAESGLPENWSWVDAETRFASAIATDAVDGTNQVFKIGGTAGADNVARAGYRYSTDGCLRTVLEYKVYIPSTDDNYKVTGAYLPTLSKDYLAIWIAPTGNLCVKDKEAAVAVANIAEETAGWKADAWQTIRLEAAAAGTYKFYLNDTLLRENAVEKANDGNWMHWIHLGQSTSYAGYIYLDNIKITAVTEKAGSDDYYAFDFEGDGVTGGEDGLPTGWKWASAANKFTPAVIADPTNASNHLFKMTLNDSDAAGDDTAYAVYDFAQAAVGGAVLEYRVYVPEISGKVAYLPTFKLAGLNGAKLNLWIAPSGNLCYGDADGALAIANGITGWHTIRVAADFTSGIYDLYLNGELVLAGKNLIGAKNGTAQIWAGLSPSKGRGGSAYLDDITVSPFVPATQFKSFSLTAGSIRVGQTSKAVLSFEPENASLQSAAFTSSNEAVARVDALGNVTGVGAGTATITATCKVGGQTVSKTADITVTTSSIAFSDNFESADAASKWTTATETNAKISVTEDSETYGNHALTIETYRNDSTDWKAYTPSTIRYTYPLKIQGTDEQASVRKAVLKYRVNIDHCVSDNNIGGGMIYLPNFVTAAGDNPVTLGSTVSVICTSVNYKDQLVAKSVGGDDWHDIEWMVDLDNAAYDLYIDGDLVANYAEVPMLSGALAPGEDRVMDSEWEVQYTEDGKPQTHGQQKILRTKDSITAIDMGFYRYTDAKISIDDLQVLNYEPATSWKIADNQLKEVAVGNSLPLTLEFTTANGKEASCRSAKITSSDTSVAVIDYNGSIIGKKAGTVTITITPNESGLESKTLTITVRDDIPATDITGVADFSLPVGGHQYIHAAVVPANATVQDVTFASSDASVAFVDEWGEVLAKKAGAAEITVSAGAFQKKITVAVNEPGVMQTFNVKDAASLLSALNSISKIDKSQMTGNIVVNLAPGYYALTETLKLNESHGGNEKYSVIFRGSGDATIGGGIKISGSSFTKGENGIYVANVPAGTKTRQLFVNDVRAVRARSEGPLTNASTLMKNGTTVGMLCDNTEIADYAHPDDVEFVFKHSYFHFRCGLDHAVTTSDGKIELYADMPGWYYIQSFFNHFEQGPAETLLYYENALELLDEPGEWYLDEAASKLYYMPRSFEDMSTVTVTIPALDGLLRIEGTDYSHEVQNITFEGITFADATWMRPSTKNGHPAAQNNGIREWDTQYDRDFMPDGTVMVKKANSVNFKNCTFARLGSTGLFMTDSVKNSTISGNHFYDISGGGTAIGDLQYGHRRTNHVNNFNPRDPQKVMKNFDVTNNYIHNTGVDYFNSCGLSVGFAANVTISHNEIFDIPYSGISIGNGWNCRFTNVQKNMKIKNNFIHDFMKDVYDGGAVYTVGNSGASVDKPNEVAYNYISDMHNLYSPLYRDAGSMCWYDHHNVINLSQRERFPDGSLPAWVLLNIWSHDLTVRNNYTTTGRTNLANQHVANHVVENNEVCENANWSEGALEIILGSGLNIANAAELRNNQAEVVKCDLTDSAELSVGQNLSINLTFCDGKDNPIARENVAIYYAIDNSEIATIDANGTVTAKKAGKTQIHVYVVSNNILHEFECSLYVGAELAEIRLRNIDGNIIPIESIGTAKLEPYGISDLGNELTLTDVTYQIADTSIAKVDTTGRVKPVADSGETTLTITATADGKTISAAFTVRILSAEGKKIIPYGTPVLDGKLDDVYTKGKKIDFGSVFYPNASAESDTDGYCYLAWDERYLYCYAYVADGDVMSAGMEYINKEHPWANDDIETYIMTTMNRPNGAMTKFACDAFGVRVYGHEVSETAEVRSELKYATAFTYNGEIIEGYQIKNPTAQQNASSKEHPVNGYVIEMTLPLYREMGVTNGKPQAGDQITFQIQVNDYDGGTPGDANTVVARKNDAYKYWLAAAPDTEEPETPVDKTQLAAAIAAAEAIDLSKYQDGAEKDAFIAALAAAKRTYADENATQDAVSAASSALTQAMNALKRKEDPVKPSPILPIIGAITGGSSNNISFRDVLKTDWFYKDVQFVAENKLMLGTDSTNFSPKATVTRAMVATILWRMEGEPAAKQASRFTDVAAGKWYSDAIAWTSENGIFTGYGSGMFGTNDPITREQLATILYRYAQYKACSLTDSAKLSSFADADRVSGYAQTAMQWSVGSGMLKGGTDGKLLPQNTATRAELAAILHRFAEKYSIL